MPPASLDDTDIRIPAHPGRGAIGPFEWRRWLAAEQPIQTALLLAVILAGAVAIGVRLGSPASGVLALGLLLASVANGLLPIRYLINGDGVTIRGVLRQRLLKWSRIDAARVGPSDATLVYTTEHSADQHDYRIDLGPHPEEVGPVLKQRLLDAGVPLV